MRCKSIHALELVFFLSNTCVFLCLSSRCYMLMDVLLGSTAPFRTASAMSSCRGMPLEHKMSEILPYSGLDIIESWDHQGFLLIFLRDGWILNWAEQHYSIVLRIFLGPISGFILHMKYYNADMPQQQKGKRQTKQENVNHMQITGWRSILQKQMNKGQRLFMPKCFSCQFAKMLAGGQNVGWH